MFKCPESGGTSLSSPGDRRAQALGPAGWFLEALEGMGAPSWRVSTTLRADSVNGTALISVC